MQQAGSISLPAWYFARAPGLRCHQTLEARLVMTDETDSRDDPMCRLAHEALIYNWPRLKKLAAADRVFLEARTRLRSDAEAWDHRAHRPDFLLPAGSRLREGEEYLCTRRDEFDGLTVKFIEQSKAAEQEARSRALQRTRRIAVALGAFATLATGLVFIIICIWEKGEDLFVKVV
jgi:hypothetical protein